MNKNNDLSHISNNKLCEIIVSSRYLGSMSEQAVTCMQELARRREAGDLFDYESYIELESKKLPDININLKKKMQISGFNFGMLQGISKVIK